MPLRYYSGIWHPMLQWNLPQWRQYDELAFLHRGNWNFEHTSPNDLVFHNNLKRRIIAPSLHNVIHGHSKFQLGLHLTFIYLPQCTNACSSFSSRHGSRCHCCTVAMMCHMPEISGVTYISCEGFKHAGRYDLIIRVIAIDIDKT